MRMHAHEEGPPCKRMEALLQQAADGSATGIRRWYALAHAARCHNCGTFLARLKLTIEAIRNAKSNSGDEDALARLRAKLKDIEAKG